MKYFITFSINVGLVESAPSAFTGSVADAAVRVVIRGGLSLFVLRFEDFVLPSDGGLIKERENGAAAIRVMLLVE